MKRKLLVKDAGILYAEIILCALQEYRQQCEACGNHSRAEVVADIIVAIQFEPSDL